MIDLQAFCGNDSRDYLRRPFSVGEFTYATNGHILVRVPRIGEITPPVDKLPIDKLEKVLSALPTTTFTAPPACVFPPIEDTEGMVAIECDYCDGRGKEHDCPDCECKCEVCGGTGKVDDEIVVSTTLAGALFNLRYVRLVLALPGVEIGTAKGLEPFLFRFLGGVGAVLPLRTKYSKHREICEPPAASLSERANV